MEQLVLFPKKAYTVRYKVKRQDCEARGCSLFAYDSYAKAFMRYSELLDKQTQGKIFDVSFTLEDYWTGHGKFGC